MTPNEFDSNAIFLDGKGYIKSLNQLFPDGLDSIKPDIVNEFNLFGEERDIDRYVALALAIIASIPTAIGLIMTYVVLNPDDDLKIIFTLLFVTCGLVVIFCLPYSIWGFIMKARRPLRQKQRIYGLTDNRWRRYALYFDVHSNELKHVKISVDYGLPKDIARRDLGNLQAEDLTKTLHDPVIQIISAEVICKFSHIFKIGYSKEMKFEESGGETSSARYRYWLYCALIFYRVTNETGTSYKMYNLNFTTSTEKSSQRGHLDQYEKMKQIINKNMRYKFAKSIKVARELKDIHLVEKFEQTHRYKDYE